MRLVLTPLVVVEMDKPLNCGIKFIISLKMIETVHLMLQDTAETLHRTIPLGTVTASESKRAR